MTLFLGEPLFSIDASDSRADPTRGIPRSVGGPDQQSQRGTEPVGQDGFDQGQLVDDVGLLLINWLRWMQVIKGSCYCCSISGSRIRSFEPPIQGNCN